MNKLILTTLTTLICTSVQSTTQYPELTNNYDDVWRADINELSKDFSYIDDDLYSMYLKDTGRKYNDPKQPINFNKINIPVLDRFTKASEHFTKDVINRFGNKPSPNRIVYVLKDRLNEIKAKQSLACEYQMKLDDRYGERYHHDLNSTKKHYVDYMIGQGYEVDTITDTDKVLLFVKTKNTYTSGSARVLVNGRILTLHLFDCQKDQGRDQIIKDLTDWSNLIVKANK